MFLLWRSISSCTKLLLEVKTNCFICKQAGYIASECRNKKNPPPKPLQLPNTLVGKKGNGQESGGTAPTRWVYNSEDTWSPDDIEEDEMATMDTEETYDTGLVAVMYPILVCSFSS